MALWKKSGAKAVKRGAHTERIFFRAAKKRVTRKGARDRTPDWFRSIRRASPSMDVRGIDFFAKVRMPKDPDGMSVPIQIKSSPSGKEHYGEKHPLNLAAGVLVLVIYHDMTDEEIRHMLYCELGKLRSLDAQHFARFFDTLLARGLTKRGRSIKKLVQRQRSKQKR